MFFENRHERSVVEREENKSFLKNEEGYVDSALYFSDSVSFG